MADVSANIHIGIDATQALGQLRALQSQISSFNNSLVAGNAAAAASQRKMRDDLSAMIGATGQFNTSIRTMETGVSSLGTAFDKGTLSARQYFRYAGSQMPGLTKAFKSLGAEQTQMANLATERVKRLQTEYVALGKDISGVQKVMAVQPKNLATGMATDLAVAQQKQQLFNRALQLGSTGLVNWGKNTQWAGRQLMVGFTIPLTIAAGAAAKFFMELDKASMQFKRVYGDLNTSTEETYRNLEAIRALGVEYTKYGAAVKDVIDIGARVAATGAQNQDLIAGTEQTLRLATLGQMEYGVALDAVTSLQTAFAVSAEDLGNKINFLNAVENQTVLTMEDMAAAVPRVAPVIKGLGGDVEDLAVFMTALREGGVSAEQGANALKSGLASLINPTSRAQETLQALGVDINAIVQANKGDLMGTVKAFGQALNSLGEFERQQALETLFGKYQYARLGALFKNIANDASQSARAMDLAGSSVEELRNMAEKELSIVSETVTNKFLGAIERLKVSIAPIGEMFLKVMTPIVDAVSAIANAFNELPDGVKTAIGAVVAVVGGLAPVFLMGIGLIGNAIGNGLKTILALRNGVKGLAATLTGSGKDFAYQSTAALDAAAAMTSLEGKVTGLTGDLLIQRSAVAALAGVYRDLAAAAAGAAAAMPNAFPMPGTGGRVRTGTTGVRPPTIVAQGFNRGGIVPGRGNSDTIPALLTPGESVVTKEATARFGPVIAAMNAGTLPGFARGQLDIGGPTPFASEFVPIERKSIRVEAAMQKVIDDLFVRHLKSAGGDITQVVGGIRTAVRQLAETGQSLTTPALVQRLKELGMYARMEGPLVFAHAQPQITLSPEEQTRMRQDFPRTQSAERMYGLGNFGFMMPEDFNKELMTGRQAATFFTDPAFVDRTMYPMYRAIADQLGRDPADVMRDPAIQRDVRAFANNIATNLTSGVMATSLIKEGDFYDISQRALSQTQMSETSRAGIESSKRMTTLAVFGGDPENRGTRGSRLGLPGRGSYKNWGLGDIISSLFGGVRRRMGANSPATEGTRAVNDFAAGMEAGSAQAEKRAGNIGTRIGGALVSSVTATVSGPQGRPSPIPQRTAEILRALPGAQPNRSQNLSFGSVGGGPRVPTIGVSGAGFIPDGEGEGRPGRFSRIASRLGGRGTAMGAGMGLSMASMLPFMMQDQQGKFMGMDANVAGMGMMGGGALLSMIGMVPGPLLAVGAAAAAAGIALAAWRNSVDNSSKAAAEFGANIGGASNALTNMANMMGKATPTQQLTQLQLGVTEEQAAAFGEFQGMMNTEAGQAFVQKLEAATSADRFSMLGDYVSAAIASGMMNVTTGQAFAKAIAGSLNDPVLGNAVSRAISQQESGAKAMLSLAEKRLAAVQETSVIQSLQGTGPGPTGGTGVGRAGALMGYEQASQAIGSSIQIIKDFAEAAAMAELEYKNGTISFAEYQNIIGQNAQVQEQYANYMRKAISLSTDTGGVMQALKAQMQGLGVTEEQFGAIEEALSISQSDLRDAGVSAADAVKASGLRLSDAVAAVASGMNPADVAAILTFTQDLSTAAGQFYAQNMGEQGALQTAGFIQAVETGLVAGVPEESRQQVIDLAVNFTGNVADLQAFLAAVPEEKVMTVVTELQSISPEQQQIYIKSVQNLASVVGQETASAIAESDEYQAALEKARGEALTTKGTRRGISNTADLQKIEKAVTDAKNAGVFTDLTSVIDFVLQEDPSDISSRLPELTGLAQEINENIPPEIQKRIGINLDDPEDLEKYGPMAEDLGKLVPILEKIPEASKEMAINLMFKKNGKAATVEQYAKDAEKLIKFSNQLQSSDLEVRKTTIVQMIQEFAGPGGTPISEQEAVGMFDELVQRFGEQTIVTLPEDTIWQVLSVRSQIVGARQALADLRAFMKAGGTMGAEEMRALNEREAALQQLLGRESDIVTTGGVGTAAPPTGGGGGGGGGGGAEDPLEAYIKDLETQKTLMGDIVKKGGELKSSLTQALRNAGAPEQLIADIVAKGEDGIKMAKKLLEDRAKELKKVAKLMLEVTRMTFIESQRAEAANLATQASSQIALANAGLNPAIIANMDPQQAQSVAAAYRAYQTAQRAADAAEGKSKQKRDDAAKALAKARKEWEMITDAVNRNTAAQDKNAIAQALLTAQQERQTAESRVSAALSLAGRGFSAEQIGGMLEIEGAANQVVAYTNKIKQLNDEKAKLEKKGKDNWSKEEEKRYKQLERQLKKVNGDYRELLRLLQQIDREKAQGAVATATAGFAGQAISARRQQRATDILMGQGYTYDQASGMAGSEENALAITKAQDAVAQGERKVNRLLQERSKYPKGSKEYKELSDKIKEARGQLDKAKTAQNNLTTSITDANKEQQKLDWQSVTGAITTEIGKQANAQKFLNMGIKDQLVLNKLNGLTLEQQNYFLSLSVEEQNAFLASLQQSITAAEKIAQSFEEIANRQRLISIQNKERANAERGNREALEDQAELIDDAARAKQKEIDAVQDTIDIYQEQNDDLQHQVDLLQRQTDLIQRQSDQLNRGLDLISQQEEEINKFYDERLEALDRVQEANSRIAQQQQDQLNLAQALSTGDIFAAAGAAQQMRANQAQFAADQARQTLEEARENALKNITVEVNGELLNREQIEERIKKNEEQIYQLNQLMIPLQDQIYANGLRIYQIQDSILEPLQNQLDLINKQRDAIADNIREWDRYYRWLEDNAVDPVTGIKFKDLAEIKDKFEALMAPKGPGQKVYTEEEAFTEATAGRGLNQETLARLKTVLFRQDTSQVITPENAAAAGEAATKATPAVTKLKDEFIKVKDAIVALIQPITKSGEKTDEIVANSVVPLQESFTIAGNIIEGDKDSLLQKLTNIRDFVTNELIPAFGNLITQLIDATVQAQALQAALAAIERNITVTVTTVYTSTGAPGGETTGSYRGGMIRGYSVGGNVFGSGTRDSVPAMLTPGEFVIRKSMVDKYGVPMLNKLNQGSLSPSYAIPNNNINYKTNTNNKSNITTVAPVYNTYSVQINAETNASADDIANKTAMKIREINNMSLRSARG